MGVYYSHYLIPRDNHIRPEPIQIGKLIDALLKFGFIPALHGPTHETGATFEVDEWWKMLPEHQKTRNWLQWLAGKPKQPPPFINLRRTFSIPPVGESLAALSSSGATIEWKVSDYLEAGTIYPLSSTPVPYGDYAGGYDLQIILSDDYINEDTDTFGATDGPCKSLNTHCLCGEDLSYTKVERNYINRIHRVCPGCATTFRPQDQIVEIVEGATGKKHPVAAGLCYRFAIIVYCGRDFPENSEDSESKDPRASSLFVETCRDALGLELYEVSLYS